MKKITIKLLETKVDNINRKLGREVIKLGKDDGYYRLGQVYQGGISTIVQGCTAREMCTALDTLYWAVCSGLMK